MKPFRSWVRSLWLDNCEERQVYGIQNKFTEQEYFQQYKWWLRREYRYQRAKEIEREKINERFRQWS